jgi:2-succinyl-5-enolpyruvyl-6-hydroxy-3-cyclohexene-1-carboxylate synthase
MTDNLSIKDGAGATKTLATADRDGAHWPKHISDHATTGIGDGVKTVTTAGTDVVLAATTAAKWVIIQAQTDNTGIIAVGASGVDATVATGTGVALAASESITLPIDDLADIFIDATVDGDGVRYTYGT